ncbi:nucleolar pre-ribosomal-associated protein 1-like [Acanthaster planci]|uniref:Nucleolar pre-ribosomal-associated protein 1-like n=1 Tax=Acanthaster planci TaxID=133434 RepID=A0A8B8A5W9_ACAPL|nr:nucleolar pre-ribosomal-associated protein 1-like [Acanthaster planci]
MLLSLEEMAEGIMSYIIGKNAFVSGGNGRRHHVLCHRIQKEACKLAVQRLTKCCEYNLPGQKTPDVMNEVIAACLQNIVTLIKKNPENTSSIVTDHLLSTSAIVKAVGTKPLSLSPSLIQAWKSLVRNGLRICYQSTDMLQLLTRLVKMIYSNAKGVNQEVDAEINNPLPLPVLYQIVLSHSLFLPTLLEDCDGNMPTKESLVLLMLAIVELEPRCCQEAHYAVLVGAYNVTRNITDTTLMKLMQHYQKNQAVPSHYKLTAWGHAAVSQHQMQKALGKSLWQQPSMKEILKQLETDVLKDSALHFPLHCKLLAETPSDPSASQISSQLYDPCFLYPLFSHLLAPGEWNLKLYLSKEN